MFLSAVKLKTTEYLKAEKEMQFAKFKNTDGVTVRINPSAVSHIEDVQDEPNASVIHLLDGRMVFVAMTSEKAEKAVCAATSK